ncbi:hypothetical protein [Campylobacter concisus]|uniref:hypothetical protein n=1 Tax=Campylobacter concisus TaxID=199 RepID=UPI000CD82E94|nr:hypothetical protein [Campylobacter concisus]
MPIELERSRWLYAPIEPFLAMEAASKSSLEYNYKGWATKRIFLPLLHTSMPKPLGYNPTQISQIY